MKQKIFFTDLDSTLILNSGNPKYLDETKYVCVSRKYGRPSGFMRLDNFQKLQEVNKIYTVIPITSRCLTSYMDVNLGFTPEYSLVDNGAILLNGREILTKWMMDSETSIENSCEVFKKCREYLISLGYFEKWGSPFVLDFSTKRKDLNNLEIKEEFLKGISNPDESPIAKYTLDGVINNYISGSLHSILIVNSKMTKEKSIKRFIDYVGNHDDIGNVYVAGDSAPDFGMLKAFENSFGTVESPANTKFSMGSGDFSKDADNISEFTSFILDKLLLNKN